MRGVDVEEALGGPLLLEAPQEPMAASSAKGERTPQHVPVGPRHTELAGCWLQVPDQYNVVLHWSARLRRLKHQIIRTFRSNDRNSSNGIPCVYCCRKTI